MNFTFLRTGAKAVLPLAMAALLSACAGAPSITMNAGDRAAIKTVKINPAVQLPEKMYYQGRGQALAMVAGPIGAVIGASAAAGPSGQLVAKMADSKISVPDILKTEFQRAAEGTGLTVVDPAAASDAEVTLQVNAYGLSQSNGFSSLYPMMNVSAVMKKSDGTIAWQKTDFASPLNSDNKTGKEFDDYMQDPELLRNAMTTISSIVSKMLVDDLKKTQ
ncbi:hypothetical protein LXA47_19615 [Massilia sp. P8910]|uniref:hypothetical protein n=1 Tax=Massilia antarctica TaxID=2765360 RepID=UPI001E5B1F85|nr:hypothetical protein [Massilia antarctica]MCE3605794.1 hypothetical protein [Massilia antarctica]